MNCSAAILKAVNAATIMTPTPMIPILRIDALPPVHTTFNLRQYILFGLKRAEFSY